MWGDKEFEENLGGGKLSQSFSTMFSKFIFSQVFNPNPLENPLV